MAYGISAEPRDAVSAPADARPAVPLAGPDARHRAAGRGRPRRPRSRTCWTSCSRTSTRRIPSSTPR
ncbi:MAG: hypothetical protein MZW92_66095 [Comamonadaceae bacterium]|nr:hypothetical protein [Comamonadaceae bacterium]